MKFYIFADAWTCVYRIGLPGDPATTYYVEDGANRPLSFCNLRRALQEAKHSNRGLTRDGSARLLDLLQRETRNEARQHEEVG